MDLECGKCGKPIEEKDTGLCETCWKRLFEGDCPDAPLPLPKNIIVLETELPF